MANVKISDLTAASAVADANQFEINESGTSKRVTTAQIKTYLTGSDLDMGGNKVTCGDVTLGNWTIKEVSGALHFLVSGTAKMKLDASGNLTVVGDVSAFGSI